MTAQQRLSEYSVAKHTHGSTCNQRKLKAIRDTIWYYYYLSIIIIIYRYYLLLFIDLQDLQVLITHLCNHHNFSITSPDGIVKPIHIFDFS